MGTFCVPQSTKAVVVYAKIGVTLEVKGSQHLTSETMHERENKDLCSWFLLLSVVDMQCVFVLMMVLPWKIV